MGDENSESRSKRIIYIVRLREQEKAAFLDIFMKEMHNSRCSEEPRITDGVRARRQKVSHEMRFTAMTFVREVHFNETRYITTRERARYVTKSVSFDCYISNVLLTFSAT